MNIQRKHLELVHAIKHNDSLVEVARSLHVTPSALSHQLNELESRIGQPIMNRKTKPVLLNAIGERLLRSAVEVLPQLERLEQDITRMIVGERGRLTIAIECHSCYQWLLPTLNEFRRSWSEVEIDISEGANVDALKSLQDGELDLVITADPEPLPGISYIPLFKYEAVVIMPPDHFLSTVEVIEPSMFTDQTLIMYPVPQRKLDIFRFFLNPANVEPAQIRHAEITVMMIALVASGRGLCVLPNWAAQEYSDQSFVISRSLGSEGIFNTLSAAVRDDSLSLSYMQEFLFLAKDLPFATLKGIALPSND